jgi:ABC-type lipoprotein release transport system permease subunit
LALLHIEDAQRIFRLEGPNGLRVKLKDAQLARQVAAELSPLLGAITRAYAARLALREASAHLPGAVLHVVC